MAAFAKHSELRADNNTPRGVAGLPLIPKPHQPRRNHLHHLDFNRLTAAERVYDHSRLLRELGQRLELEGGNPYRARAHGRAAENLSLISVPLDQLVAEGRLKEIPGIGDALAAVISQLHETGHHPRLGTMREEIPQGVLEMLRVPGLRPERVRKLYKELGIASLAELEDAACSGKLAFTKGYGEAFQAKVLQGLEMSRRRQGGHLHRAAAAIKFAVESIARTHP
jgi:DNA polymerase (family 10)